MFSGIIRHQGVVDSIQRNDAGHQIRVASELFLDASVDSGDSIAVSGVCLTFTGGSANIGRFDVASETSRVTTLGSLSVGARVNLEQSLSLGERIDGHLVSGHVDAVTRILSRELDSANTIRFRIALPAELRPFVAPKGSVAIDGVSLTVGEVREGEFVVYVIPHTLSATTLSTYTEGTLVNIEVDILARYAARAIAVLGGSHA